MTSEDFTREAHGLVVVLNAAGVTIGQLTDELAAAHERIDALEGIIRAAAARATTPPDTNDGGSPSGAIKT